MATTPGSLLLVVEDDGLIRLDLVDTLEDLGFRVVEASNADDALKLIETTAGIAAVLTDIDMPGSMDGVGLANLVHDRWPPLKLVVISGRYNPSVGVLPPGARFLTKPISDVMIGTTLKEIGVAS